MSMRNRSARPLRLLAGLTAAGILVAACGDGGGGTTTPRPDPGAGDPSSPGDGEGEGNGEGSGGLIEENPRFAEVFAEIEGLDPDARWERLVELAHEDGGQLRWYGSTSLEDLNPLIAEFTEATDGIEVSTYRALTTTVGQRIMEEANAGFSGTDVIGISSREMAAVSSAGLLVAPDSPFIENIPEDIRYADWVPTQLSIYLPGWNTDAFPEPPAETLFELFENHGDSLTFEVRQFQVFAMAVEEVLMGEQGMTEDEAVAYMRNLAEGSRAVQGTVTAVSLMGAGEFDIVWPITQHVTERIRREGAPVAWLPVIDPTFAVPAGAGIMKNGQNPAAALLWVDFYLTEGQRILQELGRTVVDSSLEGAVPQGTRILPLDEDRWEDPAEISKWQDIYGEVVRGLDVAS